MTIMFNFFKLHYYLHALKKVKDKQAKASPSRAAYIPWRYIEDFFLRTKNIRYIQTFINAYNEVFGIAYQFNLSHSQFELDDIPDITYLGNIIHIAHQTNNKIALAYLCENFNNSQLFLAVQPTRTLRVRPEVSDLPIRLLTAHTEQKHVAYLMGFHNRLGARSTLFAAKNNTHGQQAFEHDLTKEIFSYLG